MRPFTRAAAQAFIEKSGLLLGSGLLGQVLEEASEIEDMPDKVRPIVLNMFGLVVASFTGTLPKGVRAGRLLSGYVERCLKSSGTRGVDVLRPLVTDAGTKRTQSTEQIAQNVHVEPAVARGCLNNLAKDGLVRRLKGVPERWEVAHDFVARLLQPLCETGADRLGAHPTYYVPVLLAIWIVVMGWLILIAPARIREELADWGIYITNEKWGAVANSFGAFEQENLAVVVQLLRRSSVVDLGLSGTQVANLEPLKGLIALQQLHLSNTKVANLEPLKGLIALQQLDLSNTPVVNLEPLKGLRILQRLNLINTKVARTWSPEGADNASAARPLQHTGRQSGAAERG